jgi:hypothetical protein
LSNTFLEVLLAAFVYDNLGRPALTNASWEKTVLRLKREGRQEATGSSVHLT